VHCQHLTHEECCQWVRTAREEQTVLVLSSFRLPYCQSCLDRVQADGTSLLITQRFGLVLLRHQADDTSNL